MVHRLKLSSHLLVNNTPVIKKKGIFIVSDDSLYRPEVIAHKKRLASIFSPSNNNLIIISLLHADLNEIYDLFKSIKAFLKLNTTKASTFNFLILDPVFGLYPLEISESFPLTQYIAVDSLSRENIHKIVHSSLIQLSEFRINTLYLLGNLSALNEVEQKHNILSQMNLNLKSFDFPVDDTAKSNILFILEQLFGN